MNGEMHPIWSIRSRKPSVLASWRRSSRRTPRRSWSCVGLSMQWVTAIVSMSDRCQAALTWCSRGCGNSSMSMVVSGTCTAALGVGCRRRGETIGLRNCSETPREIDGRSASCAVAAGKSSSSGNVKSARPTKSGFRRESSIFWSHAERDRRHFARHTERRGLSCRLFGGSGDGEG
jgi:hypothetical protein